MLFKSLQMSVRCLRSANILQMQSIETQIRAQNYSGWVHRRPSAVINQEVVLDESEVIPRKYVDEDTEHRPLKKKPQKRQMRAKPVRPVIIRSNETFKEDGTLNYTTILNDDRELSSLMLNLKSKKTRAKSNQIVLEGSRLITDAILAGLKPNIMMFSRPKDVLKIPLPQENVQLFKVPYNTLQLWSSLTTTPGIMGIFELPETLEKEETKDTIPLTIICDNVREPGNLGTILRAAAGVGCERVILTKGCVDLWDAKVLRSGAGAHFRVSILNSVEWEEVQSLISPMAKIFAADNNAMPSSETESETRQDSSSNEAEYAAKSQAPEAETREISNSNEAECESTSEPAHDSETERKVDDQEKTAPSVSPKELASLVPIIPYYAVDYTTNEVVLIIGGETHGLSFECVELIRENGGTRVNVPLTNQVDSLNTGMALGIVAFEIKKQFLIRRSKIANNE